LDGLIPNSISWLVNLLGIVELGLCDNYRPPQGAQANQEIVNSIFFPYLSFSSEM